jgi:hypothetical protein
LFVVASIEILNDSSRGVVRARNLLHEIKPRPLRGSPEGGSMRKIITDPFEINSSLDGVAPPTSASPSSFFAKRFAGSPETEPEANGVGRQWAFFAWVYASIFLFIGYTILAAALLVRFKVLT